MSRLPTVREPPGTWGRPAVGALILGAGRRFGGTKQLAQLHGQPLLQRVIDAVGAVTTLAPIVVVVGARAEQVLAAVELHGASAVVCDEWQEGMAASLRCGLAALGDVDAALIVLGDQPLITPQVLAAVVDAYDEPEPAARAVYDGVPGHPVLIKRPLFDAVTRLRGDRGARDVLATVAVREVPCAHLGPPDDVDTPEQLAALGRSARLPGR